MTVVIFLTLDADCSLAFRPDRQRIGRICLKRTLKAQKICFTQLRDRLGRSSCLQPCRIRQNTCQDDSLPLFHSLQINRQFVAVLHSRFPGPGNAVSWFQSVFLVPSAAGNTPLLTAWQKPVTGNQQHSQQSCRNPAHFSFHVDSFPPRSSARRRQFQSMPAFLLCQERTRFILTSLFFSIIYDTALRTKSFLPGTAAQAASPSPADGEKSFGSCSFHHPPGSVHSVQDPGCRQ